MTESELICESCEAEFYIEHGQDEISFCPFCGEEFVHVIEHEEDVEWDE